MSEQSQNQSADGASSSTLGAVTATLSGAGQAISNTATNAYNNAPDLGITRTVQSTYNNAPDMGVSQGAEKLTVGAGGASSSGQQNGSSSQSKEGGDDSAEDGAQVVQREQEERVEESKRAGPSSEKRLNKSQTEIGIEDKIPTAAGYGTTLPPDTTVQESAGKKANKQQASVPEDYEPIDCPSEHCANGTKKEHHSSSGANGDAVAAHQGGAEEGGAANGDRKLGQKIKDKIKGEVKVVSGVVGRNEEKVEAGKAIKRGEA